MMYTPKNVMFVLDRPCIISLRGFSVSWAFRLGRPLLFSPVPPPPPPSALILNTKYNVDYITMHALFIYGKPDGQTFRLSADGDAHWNSKREYWIDRITGSQIHGVAGAWRHTLRHSAGNVSYPMLPVVASRDVISVWSFVRLHF
jgi:hypothetical protein